MIFHLKAVTVIKCRHHLKNIIQIHQITFMYSEKPAVFQPRLIIIQRLILKIRLFSRMNPAGAFFRLNIYNIRYIENLKAGSGIAPGFY